ncbi:hypothetical protein T492DRAFT_1144748 [Pavlovales sp. CCMP2436]|nr:hypothetical protein T492DRAFT_1144748 [Pavlovales sp. CCMP2436]
MRSCVGLALALLAALALARDVDLVDEIAAEANCMHADFVLEKHGEPGIDGAEGLLREALARDPHSRARELFDALRAYLAEKGRGLSAASEEALAAPVPSKRALPPPSSGLTPKASPSATTAAERMERKAAMLVKAEATAKQQLSLAAANGDGLARASLIMTQAMELQQGDVDSYTSTPKVLPPPFPTNEVYACGIITLGNSVMGLI